MLTLRRSPTAGRPPYTVVGLIMATLIAGFLLALPGPAAADECWQWVETTPGHMVYVNTCDDGGGSGGTEDGGGGGGGEPTCDLSQEPYTEFCNGEAACWGRIPALWSGEGFEEPPPSPDAVLAYRQCRSPDGTVTPEWYWTQSEGPSLEELAMQAFGNLQAPAFTLTFNPPRRAFVNLATWFWADGAGEGTVTGSSAAGLVAVAAPDHIDVDPGDGSSAMTCPWIIARSDACSHTYERASVEGTSSSPAGEPAYPARGRLVYTVRFELNGEQIDIPGAPDRFESPWQQTPVPVAEIQAIVE